MKRLNIKPDLREARGNALRLLAVSAAFCLLLPASARAQDDSDIRARLDQMQNDIQTLNHAVYKGEMPPPSMVPPDEAGGGAAQAQLQVKISQLETEITNMTGRLEEEQHRIDTLDDTLAKLGQRMTALEQKGSVTAVPAQTGAIPPTLTQPGGQAGLTGSDMQPPTGDSPGGDHFAVATPSSATPVSSAMPPQPAAPGSIGTLTQQDVDTPPAATPPAADTPDGLYQQAYAQLKDQKYDAAEKGFQDFLTRYPKNAQAGNAQYWLGETYYVRAQYQKATKAFASAYQNYPQNPKGPDALLKLGMSLNALGQHDSSCLTFGQLKKQFPAAGAIVARADQEAQKAGCK